MVERLLVNVLSVFLCFFVFQLWINYRKKITSHAKSETFVIAAIAIMICITFPVFASVDFRLDLRILPFWLGSLYGGWDVSFLLLVVSILYRSLFGGVGIWSALLVAIMQVVVTFFLHKRFIQASSKRKVIIGTTLAFGSSLYWLMAIQMFGGSLPLGTFLLYALVNVVSMFIMMISVETMRSHLKNKQYLPQIVKYETVSQLSASLSHEIRNKLTTTKGFLQLKREIEQDETQVRYTEVALSELKGAEQLIEDYLSYAKPMEEEQETLDVEEEIHRVLNVLYPMANHYCVEMIIETSPSLFVQGDSSVFRQALLNLFKNGMEAMQNGGKLVVRAYRENQLIVLQVKDTGTGMTNEQLERLGEAYFSTKGDRGTGLGVMVAYRAVQSMNGKIEVTSERGLGTQFVLRFPECEKMINEQKILV